jgi:hypothetical protein
MYGYARKERVDKTDNFRTGTKNEKLIIMDLAVKEKINT